MNVIPFAISVLLLKPLPQMLQSSMTLLLTGIKFLKHLVLLLSLALHVHLLYLPIPNGVLSMKQETIPLTSVLAYTVLNVISLLPRLTHRGKLRAQVKTTQANV